MKRAAYFTNSAEYFRKWKDRRAKLKFQSNTINHESAIYSGTVFSSFLNIQSGLDYLARQPFLPLDFLCWPIPNFQNAW